MMEAVRSHSPVTVGAAEDHMREGEVGVEVNRLGQFRDCLVEVARHRVHISGGEMRPGVVRIGLDGFLRHCARFHDRRLLARPAELKGCSVGPGQEAHGARIVRPDIQGALQQVLRGRDVLRRKPGPDIGHRLHHKSPCVEAFRPSTLEALVLGCVELGLDRPDDAPGDIILEREEVREFDIVALRPDMTPGRGVGKLRPNAKALARAPDAAVQHVPDAQRPPDLSNVEGLPPVSEGRVARRNEQPAQAREPRDDVLGETVREVLLLDVLGQILERQNGDGRRRFLRLIRGALRKRLDRSGEPIAEARSGRDPVRALGCLAQKLAQGGDLHRKVALLDRKTRPGRLHQLGPGEVLPRPSQKSRQQEEPAVADRRRGAVPRKRAGAQIEHKGTESELLSGHLREYTTLREISGLFGLRLRTARPCRGQTPVVPPGKRMR
jgi:hypothetical protein